MKRHGLIVFLVALFVLPIVSIVFTACAQQEKVAAAAPAPKADEAEKAMLAQLKKAQAKAAAEKKANLAAWLKEMEEKKLASTRKAALAGRTAFQNENAHFDFDKYFIRVDAAKVIRAKAEYLKARPMVTVEIQGHADERGTVDYNLALGDRRAHAAASFLTSLGISADRIETVTYGEEKPIDPGHNQAAWARNRRAQFMIISE